MPTPLSAPPAAQQPRRYLVLHYPTGLNAGFPVASEEEGQTLVAEWERLRRTRRPWWARWLGAAPAVLRGSAWAADVSAVLAVRVHTETPDVDPENAARLALADRQIQLMDRTLKRLDQDDDPDNDPDAWKRK